MSLFVAFLPSDNDGSGAALAHNTALLALPDGRLLSGSRDLTVKVWAVPPAAGALALCSATLEGHTRFVTALTRLPDGRVLSGSGDGTVRVWA